MLTWFKNKVYFLKKPFSSYAARFSLAAVLSLVLHLTLVVIMEPSYSPIRDFAVDFEVEFSKKKKQKKVVEPEGKKSPEKKESKNKEKLSDKKKDGVKAGKAKDKQKEKTKNLDAGIESDSGIDEAVDAGVSDAGARSDSGISKASDADTYADSGALVNEDAGAGEDASDGGVAGERGPGICMKDLFEFASYSPRWLVWVSTGSFVDTRYESALNRTLGAFGLGRQMMRATGLKPVGDINTMMAMTNNIMDFNSFDIFIAHEKNKGELKAAIDAFTKDMGDNAGWAKTENGEMISVTPSQDLHLLNSDKILSVTSQKASDDKKQKDKTIKKMQSWPEKAQCIKLAQSLPSFDKTTLLGRARVNMKPDKDGHWPIAVLATRESWAIGLHPGVFKDNEFIDTVIYGYFSEPMRIEGTIRLKKGGKKLQIIAAKFKEVALRAAKNPFIAITGLSPIFSNLKITTHGKEIRFVIPLNERQILKILVFLSMQGDAMERARNKK